MGNLREGQQTVERRRWGLLVVGDEDQSVYQAEQLRKIKYFRFLFCGAYSLALPLPAAESAPIRTDNFLSVSHYLTYKLYVVLLI